MNDVQSLRVSLVRELETLNAKLDRLSRNTDQALSRKVQLESMIAVIDQQASPSLDA